MITIHNRSIFFIGPENKGCGNYVCVEYMSVEDGKECIGPYVCKAGRVCIEGNTSKTGFICVEVQTQVSSELTCDTDADCPSDSECDCNTITGKSICVPKRYSDSDALELYKKLIAAEEGSAREAAYEEALDRFYRPFAEEYRCNEQKPIPVEPSSSSSAYKGFVPPSSYSSPSYEEGDSRDSSKDKEKGNDGSFNKPIALSFWVFIVAFVRCLF